MTALQTRSEWIVIYMSCSAVVLPVGACKVPWMSEETNVGGLLSSGSEVQKHCMWVDSILISQGRPEEKENTRKNSVQSKEQHNVQQLIEDSVLFISMHALCS